MAARAVPTLYPAAGAVRIIQGRTNPMYVEEAMPIGLWQYRARIWFDPNSA